jgi:hypothetical protein
MMVPMAYFKIIAPFFVAFTAFSCWYLGFPQGFAIIAVVAVGLCVCWRQEKSLARNMVITRRVKDRYRQARLDGWRERQSR